MKKDGVLNLETVESSSRLLVSVAPATVSSSSCIHLSLSLCPPKLLLLFSFSFPPSFLPSCWERALPPLSCAHFRTWSSPPFLSSVDAQKNWVAREKKGGREAAKWA